MWFPTLLPRTIASAEGRVVGSAGRVHLCDVMEPGGVMRYLMAIVAHESSILGDKADAW